MLAGAISQLVPRLKIKPSKPNIENVVFKMHYVMTVAALLGFVIIVCGKEYFGDSIKCVVDKAVKTEVIETYCFFMGTYTIEERYDESLLRSNHLPHPGVGSPGINDKKIYHTYYQWVPFVLFFQCVCFYVTHYIWKKKEGGRIAALIDGLRYAKMAQESEGLTVAGVEIPSKENVKKRINMIRNDIILRLKISRTWSVWLVSLEVVNLLHVIFQIWLNNKFLNGYFMPMGTWAFNSTNWSQKADPLEFVFPKVTKCDFRKIGPSGTMQNHDAMCVMSLNIVHENIYMIMWFWFLFLFIASLLAVVWRIACFVLYRRMPGFTQTVFSRVSAGKFDSDTICRVINRCSFADWLFLYYLASNMNGFLFQELFTQLSDELRDEEVGDYSKTKLGGLPMLEKGAYNDDTLPQKPVGFYYE